MVERTRGGCRYSSQFAPSAGMDFLTREGHLQFGDLERDVRPFRLWSNVKIILSGSDEPTLQRFEGRNDSLFVFRSFNTKRVTPHSPR